MTSAHSPASDWQVSRSDGYQGVSSPSATFKRSLTACPGFAEAHNNLGNLQHRHGNLEEALAAFRRAIEINPEYAEAHRNLSHVLLLAGRLDEGWQEFR